MKLISTIFLIIYLNFIQFICLYQCKVFTRCGFRDELVRLRFKGELIPSWICLVASESSFDTSKIGIGPSGSQKYGVFQINNLEFCKKGEEGGLCKMKCEDLLDENIVDDGKCAEKIFNRDGFKAWSGWNRSCTGRIDQLAEIVVHCPQSPILKRKTSVLIEEYRRNLTTLGPSECNLINGCGNLRTNKKIRRIKK